MFIWRKQIVDSRPLDRSNKIIDCFNISLTCDKGNEVTKNKFNEIQRIGVIDNLGINNQRHSNLAQMNMNKNKNVHLKKKKKVSQTKKKTFILYGRFSSVCIMKIDKKKTFTD